MKLPFLLFLFLPAFFLSGCRKEDTIYMDPEKEVFNFVVTEAQREYINSSRGEQYIVSDPVPELHFAGEIYPLDKFEIRGDNTLNFTRKGFSINMDRKITLYNPEEQSERKYEEFKLLAMVYDYTYIENSVAVGLFKEVGLWPVLNFFTEVRLSDHTQGLYHFIEDPFEYFIEQKDASFVVRRGYDHVLKKFFTNPANQSDQEKYISRFRKIYSDIARYSGKQLLDTLLTYVDLEQYFTKLSIDMLLKNGDYTDEIIFYTKIKDGKEVFGVFPWDLDDLFADEPHEVGNPWAPGTVFGQREYFSMDDIIADVGSKLLFSIEDDLDYKISKDDVLYQNYLETLNMVLDKIDPAVIDKVFDYTFEHIGPFYSDNSIIEQSKYDVDETTYDLFVNNLAEKRQMIKDRRNFILTRLYEQQNR